MRLAPRIVRRLCSSTTRGGPPPPQRPVRDAWHDDTFARHWSHGGGLEKTNPDRDRQLHLLASLVSTRCASHRKSTGMHARVLDLGVGSGLAAQRLLADMPPDSSIVGVDNSEAMLSLLHEGPPNSRLTSFHIDFDDLARSKAALGLAGPNGDRGRFACAVAVQSLHEVSDMTKRRALSFCRRALQPDGTLFILDRHRFDLASPLADAHEALWPALHRSPFEPSYAWSEYAEHMRLKRDDAWASAQHAVQLCHESGYHAEVLYSAFNRFLVAAKPHAPEDAAKRRDFEAWRDRAVEQATRTARARTPTGTRRGFTPSSTPAPSSPPARPRNPVRSGTDE